MSAVTIVPDDILSKLVAGQHVVSAPIEILAETERVFGSYKPEPELLRATIDAVFWASLSEEEGKPALARIGFADIRDPSCRLQPCAVSADAIRKLSPLLDVPSNALLIRRDAKIVGVSSWRYGRIGIIAHRPGRLAVVDGHTVLGVFDRGNWVVVGGGSHSVISMLQKALPGDDFPVRYAKAGMIMGLVTRARRAGRGAIFVVAPPDCREGIGSVSYPVEEFPALPQALEKWRQWRDAPPQLTAGAWMQHEWIEEMREAEIVGLRQHATAIAAAGAGIDGVTLIDDSSLRVLGFGAKINAPDDDLDVRVMELPNTESYLMKKKDLGGMRHQSAARLVQVNNEATVITVSQDGPVSLFAWVRDASNVLMIKHLDRYFEGEARFD